MAKMKRLVKLEGRRNVQMVEDDIPTPGPDEILVRLRRSLISRGTELFGRYDNPDSASPQRMGYSDSGDIVEVGRDVRVVEPGGRVMVNAPHAQYVLAKPFIGEARPYESVASVLPEGMSYEKGAFLHLTNGTVAWMEATPLESGGTVVILGQGLVGNLCSQAIRERKPGRVITVDALDLRCRLSRECGNEEVINCSEADTVETVLEMTGGRGADLVVDCVGGPAGMKSFQEAQQIVSDRGAIHLIALYQGGPVPLDSTRMQGKQMVFGYWSSPTPWRTHMQDTMERVMDGRIRIDPIITHRLPWQETAEAYHMLFDNPDKAFGVILDWEA